MTTEQMIAIGGLMILGLIGLIGWFLRRLIFGLEEKQKATDDAVKALSAQFSNWRLTVEQNFVSFDTFETMRTEFRANFTSLFEKAAQGAEILARLDERSKADDRLANVLTMLTKGKR